MPALTLRHACPGGGCAAAGSPPSKRRYSTAALPAPTRVAAGWLHQDGLVGGDEPRLLRPLDHVESNAVLDCTQGPRAGGSCLLVLIAAAGVGLRGQTACSGEQLRGVSPGCSWRRARQQQQAAAAGGSSGELSGQAPGAAGSTSAPEEQGSRDSSLQTMSAKHMSFTLFSRTCSSKGKAGVIRRHGRAVARRRQARVPPGWWNAACALPRGEQRRHAACAACGRRPCMADHRPARGAA